MRTKRTIFIALSILAGLLLAPSPAQAADPDVSVNYIYSSLSIVGDDGDNHVILSTTPPDPWGAVTLRIGIVQTDGSVESQLIHQFRGNLSVYLKGGNDRLVLAKSFTNFRSRSHFPGNVRLRGGEGDDMIDASRVDFAGDVDVLGEGGVDAAEFRSTSVHGELMVKGGGSSGFRILAEQTVVSGDAVFGDGEGDYEILADYSTFSSLAIVTGGEDDYIQSWYSFLGTDPVIMTLDGEDEIQMDSDYDGRLYVDTGSDDDEFWIYDKPSELTVKMGSGDDRTSLIQLETLSGDSFDGGTGNDWMVLAKVTGPTTGIESYEEVEIR